MAPYGLLTEGCLVTTKGLSREDLNDRRGGVVGWQGSDRVVVAIEGGMGRKALRPDNLEVDKSYMTTAFIINLAALMLSVAYISASVFNPWSETGNFFWKIALFLHIVHYARMCKNMGLIQLRTDALGSLAGNRAGQVLLWLVAFFFLGQSCYFLLAAMGCYSVIFLARIHEFVIPPAVGEAPLISLFTHNLSKVNKGLANTEYAMVEYNSRDWTGLVKPTPPAHPLEIAGVIFELFVGVQQFFQIVLAATQSFIMFILSWRYLGYRYRTPENRTVRTVFSMPPSQII
eukprot:TRINITY_DN21619_c0_g1_i2.p1 TRINITY_DN21619_c0_g1~~TRINITY_DN21619_c0_g1_i2.p1  ORF type:complete len:302 (+),score=41.19 TRINITY_DN21619_c0_g1_i2:45-908(+)